MKTNTVIIMTHIGVDGYPLLPHLYHLFRSNPSVDVRIVIGKDSPQGKKYNWKNCDQPLRAWWKQHGHTVTTPHIVLLEWDVLVSAPLPAMPEHLDLAGKTVFRPGDGQSWHWWGDIPQLRHPNTKDIIGLVPFGVTFVRRHILDAICKPVWDDVYSRDVMCELRFPSIAKAEGARVGNMDLPYSEWFPVNPRSTPGIYHAVKNWVEKIN